MTATRDRDRRALLRSLGAAGLCTLAGCSSTAPDPSIVAPSTALVDEPVRIGIEGLDPGSSPIVRASAQSRDGTTWASHARFDAGDDGTVAVPEQAPVDGTYERADPMGLFWSMRPVDAAPDEPLAPDERFVPDASGYDVTLRVEVDGEPVAETTTTRRLFDPGIARRTVEGPEVVGGFFPPPGDDPAPAVLHLHGAGGRPHLAKGRLLASRGFATLALQYFGDPDPIPDTLTEVPVEGVERAIAWLRDRERVAGPEVGLFGFSRGGELALLLGSRTDDVGAIVGWVPSGLVWEGLGDGRAPADTSAWSVDGEPVPYLELAAADPGPPPTPALPFYEPALERAGADDLAAAAVPVEEADAPIYLASATDDRRWPSTALSARVVDRLAEHEYPHGYRHDSFEGAGHFLGLPFLPTAGTSRDRWNVYGGSPAANARARSRAWTETLSVLESTLRE